MGIYKCKMCNKEFESKYKNAVYCSDKCREAAAKERESLRIRKRRTRKNYNTKTLLKTVELANKYGLSYGNFVAKRRLGII